MHSPQAQRLVQIGCTLALSFAFVGCGGPTSVQEAPQSNDIQQYIKDHPEILLEDELDAADEAVIE